MPVWQSRVGWWAEHVEDPDELLDPDHPWRPVLQTPGIMHSLDAWFPTEEACLAYIRQHILGKGLMDD